MKSEITISTDMIIKLISAEEKDLADYQALGDTQMEYFAIGRLGVWRNLLDVYAK